MMHISWAFRDAEMQNLFYNQGKSRCIFPNSSHNKQDKDGKPCSRALDLFIISIEGIAQFPEPFYTKLAKWIFDKGYKIKAGIIAPGFSEKDHFQITDDTI